MSKSFYPYFMAAMMLAADSHHYRVRRSKPALKPVRCEEAHTPLNKYKVHGVDIEARNKKDAIKKYNIKYK